MTLSETATLEKHHNALVYVREDVPLGDMVQELTTVEPYVQMLFASSQTWRDTLRLIEQTKGRLGCRSRQTSVGSEV